MAEERDPATGTTVSTPSGTTASAAGGSGAPAGGSAATETAEELKKRLEESERKNAQLLAEKSNTEEERKRLEEERRRLDEDRARTASTPPNNAGAGALSTNPVLAQIQQLHAAVVQQLQQFPNDATAMAQKWRLEQDYNAELQRQQRETFMEGAKRSLMTVPEALRGKVEARFMTGQYASIEAAWQVERELSDAESKATASARERDELKKDEEARKRAQEAAGPAGITPAQTSGNRMRLSEYTRKIESLERGTAAEKAEARKLIREADTGRLQIIDG